RLGAGVPMDHDILSKRSGRCRWCHQYGVAAVKEGRLQCAHAGAARAGPAQHCHVVDPCQAAKRAVLDGRAAAPAESRAHALTCGMRGAEGTERLTRAPTELRLITL